MQNARISWQAGLARGIVALLLFVSGPGASQAGTLSDWNSGAEGYEDALQEIGDDDKFSDIWSLRPQVESSILAAGWQPPAQASGSVMAASS